MLTFCERVTATATSPWHIRRVGTEGVKLGGGAPDTTLCGASLGGGWDLRLEVTDETVKRVRPCMGCEYVYLAAVLPGESRKDPDESV